MFKNHPKGLLSAALANMGERFGFYTMMAILVLFLQAKFGLDGKDAGYIYATFYFLIYILAFIGGLIADKTRNYKGTILTGLVLMTIGYGMISIPTPTPVANLKLELIIACAGLFVIALGNGLFKGNLQALVGQMYDNEKYGKLRDSGFSLFYMFINVGAIFAPMAAIGVRNYWLNSKGFLYNAELPNFCHSYLSGNLSADATVKMQEAANLVSGTEVADLTTFAHNYLNVFSEGFNYAFAVAIGAMLLSLIIFVANKSKLPDAKKHTDTKNDVADMDPAEVKQRLLALFAVFGVVIFFWFSFHQNGLTLTYFARDYTQLSIGSMPISVEIFQSLNPFFVVFLTPLVLWFFARQREKGTEPSTPKKIAIGMAIAAFGYIIMAVGSYALPMFSDVEAAGGLDNSLKVTPYLLMACYFVLTIAELYISPLGLSFVSKVAPPKLQGLMQGCWLGATAIGNQLLFIGAILYEQVPIWLTWTVFVVACLISMFTMLVMLKWLEKIAK